jgi:DNA polymerase-3 subunit alpha
LEQKIADGLIVLDDVHSYDEYKSRMIYELLIIEKMGYEQYYLIVWDFIQYAKKQGIPVGPGRGSGAGSLVAYLIGITEVDSIRYNLLFERFLNPERVSMPDFDTDFCYNRREEVIQYVSQRYGIDHVSQIVTFGTMAARAAVRDVGRVLGMSYAEIDDVARKIPREMGITITKALEDPDLKIQYRNNEKIKKLLDLAIAIEGMPRHASTHAAGVVITKDPISTYVPMSKNGDTIVTQFDMDTIASLGLLKFDFLGLRYLTILSDAEKEVQKIQPDFSLSKIDLNDQDTYCLIASGKTDGVFQLESAGMKRLLANMKPNKLEDIMISIALYRPGPMDSIPKFLENREKSKSEKLTYPITILADILDCTYGCIIYQEQVMQICRKVAGFSYGKADIIRKAMSKKKGALLENERSAFLTGAKKNLISEKDADALFEEMVGFAKYAFNKSHAAAYSIVTYRTAYLKTHYPAPFFAALLTSVIGDPNKTSAYADDCMHFGIQILPPDINTSESNFSVSGQNILYGLTGIRSIGDGFVKNILKERKKGKFVSFMNFCTRMIGTELTKQQLQALISVGAFDSLDQNRAVLLASYESVYAAVQSKQKIELDGQTNLFAQEESEREENYPYPKLPDLTSRQKLILEKANIGVYLTGNLLDDYQQHIQQIPYFNIASILHSFDENSEDFGTLKDSQCVTVVGILSKVIKKTTKNKEEMAFLTIEDRTGEIEAIAFSKIYSENSDFLNQDTAVAVYGEIASREEESPKLIIRKIIPLKSNHEYQDSAATSVSSPVSTPKNIRYGGDPVGNKLYIRLESFNSPLVKKVQTICEIFCDGNCKVFLFERASGKYLTWSGFITADEYVVTLLRKLVGNENVVVRN